MADRLRSVAKGHVLLMPSILARGGPAHSDAIHLGGGLTIAATATNSGSKPQNSPRGAYSVVIDVEQITLRHAVAIDSPARSALRTTGFAALLAGRRRSHLYREWVALLAGSPEYGVTFSSGRQFVLALGFLCAALRMRMNDLARLLWRPVDWLLSTSSRTNAFIAAVVGMQAIYIVRHDGLTALVTEVWHPCALAGAALFALAHWLRRVRGIDPATTDKKGADE
ncbi:hypothetical protein GT025_18945 [Streptomyces sp. SID4920]|nr:hypothetical protein [Streptomyces sp. SID4920]MYX70823.1 hypothetical protein [Streptomyces sp. SID8373]